MSRLRIDHINTLPLYLQQRINDAIKQELRAYMKPSGRYVTLVIGEKVPMIKQVYRTMSAKRYSGSTLKSCKDYVDTLFK